MANKTFKQHIDGLIKIKERFDGVASTALCTYTQGSPREAAAILRKFADTIDAEADAHDAYRFDADGLADHQRARSEP